MCYGRGLAVAAILVHNHYTGDIPASGRIMVILYHIWMLKEIRQGSAGRCYRYTEGDYWQYRLYNVLYNTVHVVKEKWLPARIELRKYNLSPLPGAISEVLKYFGFESKFGKLVIRHEVSAEK